MSLLTFSSEFGVQSFGRSTILPLLKQKYPGWLRSEIRAVRIIQKNRSVFLEMVTDPQSQKYYADEEVSRIDLGFIYENGKMAFPPGRTAQENAEWFVGSFDPYSLIVCTSLFTPEGCQEVNDLYQQGKL